MINLKCAACGELLTAGGVGIGGVLLCRGCAPAVRSEIYRLRAKGKRVDAAEIAYKMGKGVQND